MQHEHLFSNNKAFDGMTLFSLKRLPDEVKTEIEVFFFVIKVFKKISEILDHRSYKYKKK